MEELESRAGAQSSVRKMRTPKCMISRDPFSATASGVAPQGPGQGEDMGLRQVLMSHG